MLVIIYCSESIQISRKYVDLWQKFKFSNVLPVKVTFQLYICLRYNSGYYPLFVYLLNYTSNRIFYYIFFKDETYGLALSVVNKPNKIRIFSKKSVGCTAGQVCGFVAPTTRQKANKRTLPTYDEKNIT